MADRILLSSKDVASFVTHGFLRLDGVVPPALCEAALKELGKGFPPTPYRAAGASPQAGWPGQPLEHMWPGSPAIGPFLRLPRVAGAIESLLGRGALYDHHFVHVVPPGERWSQPWHADAILDPRTRAFDVQLFCFFHDTPREAGGTMILPGSHLRRVNESDVARAQNFKGQLATVCRAGTVVVCHHGIWHSGQPNLTQAPRTMLKLRLGPATPQVLTWDLRDLDDPSIADILRQDHPWTGNQARLEIVGRIKLWRTLTADPRFDVDYWLTRIEGPPGQPRR